MAADDRAGDRPVRILTHCNAGWLATVDWGTALADLQGALHEVSEATMTGRGLSYEAAHAGALGKYGVSLVSVYHPEGIILNPASFNLNWFNFWGIK